MRSVHCRDPTATDTRPVPPAHTRGMGHDPLSYGTPGATRWDNLAGPNPAPQRKPPQSACDHLGAVDRERHQRHAVRGGQSAEAVSQRAGVAAPCAGGASIPASTTLALAPCAGRMIASGAAVIERMSPHRRPSLAPSASTTTCARRASAPAIHPAASTAVAPARAVVVTSARTRSSPPIVRAPPGTPPRRRSRFPRSASRRSSAARVRRPRSPRSTGLSSPRASPICPAGATRAPRATSTRPGSPRRARSGSPCRWRSCSRRPARGAPAATAGTPSASTPLPASTRAGQHHPVRTRACSATDACTVARQCASSWRPRTRTPAAGGLPTPVDALARAVGRGCLRRLDRPLPQAEFGVALLFPTAALAEASSPALAPTSQSPMSSCTTTDPPRTPKSPARPSWAPMRGRGLKDSEPSVVFSPTLVFQTPS